jgi:transposase
VCDLTREVLAAIDKDFCTLYGREGRPSIQPEQLLAAFLLQVVLIGVRSERPLMEQLTTTSCFAGSSACLAMRSRGTQRR